MSIRVKLPAPIVPRPADAVIVVDELVMDGYCDLPLWMIRASRTNRTYFNVDALQQLADNIAEVGILQPILVRPVTPTGEQPQHYEIIAGERRFRAAVIACLAVAPVRVRAMTDLQAAELQLIENLQREDPHPLEEAEGMQTLMLNHGYNADQVAAAVKQSRSYVYGRLKLCELAKSVREQFMGEQFNASIGLLIARLPTPKLQAQAAKEIQQGNGYNGEPMSFRIARDHVRRNYMLDLDKAVFPIKDASLIATAGSCVECPKRAGNQAELYPDAKDADICTESACFEEKTAAFQQRKRDEATSKGLPIISGDAALKIMPNSYSKLRGGYADIDADMWVESKHTTYRKILGKGLPPVSLLENPHQPGKFLQIARTDELEDLVEAKAGQGKTEASRAAAAKAKEKTQEREATIERQYRKDLFTAVRISQTDMPRYDEREVAVMLFRTCYDQADTFISKCWGWDGKEFETGHVDGRWVNRSDRIAEVIRTFEPSKARQLIRDLVLARDLPVNTYTPGNETPKLLLAAADELGIDAPAIRDELARAAKVKEQEKATKAKKKANKAKPPAQAEIAMEPPAAVQHEAAAQPADEALIDLAVLQDADTLRAFIAADPAKLNDLTPMVIKHAPHLLKTIDVAGHETGYMWRDNEWHAPAPRKTLTLKPRATSNDSSDNAPDGPEIRTKKPARTISLPGVLAYTAPESDNANE
jgi:ParB/RepB/Spo0J family partition protein